MSLTTQPRGTLATTVRSSPGAAASPFLHWLLERLVRLGFVVRGIIYVVPGVLALRLALGRSGGEISPTSAIDQIGHEPFGRILLVGIAIGLAGYASWGVIRAVFDPLHKGRSSGGVVKRLGYATSALAYLALLAATLRYAITPTSEMGNTPDWTVAVLAKPLGAWLVAIIAVCWIVGAGLVQIVFGWRGTFEADLALERMNGSERRWANRLGRFGFVARGAIFTIIGVLMIAAALHANPRGSAGMGGTLIEILRQPYGRVLLVAAAAGLIAFGAFSIMCARWMRIRPAASISRLSASRSSSQ